jgi:cell division protein FtsB
MKRLITKILTRLVGVLTPARALALALVGIFFWWFILGDQGVYQLRRLIDMKNRLIRERSVLNDDIDSLKQEKELLSDPAKLEMVIRKELGYIRPGEIVFKEKKSTSAEE